MTWWAWLIIGVLAAVIIILLALLVSTAKMFGDVLGGFFGWRR